MRQEQPQTKAERQATAIFMTIIAGIGMWLLNPTLTIILLAIVITAVITTVTLAVIAFFKNGNFNQWVISKLGK